MKIVVALDRVILDEMTDTLRSEGYEVLATSDPNEAEAMWLYGDEEDISGSEFPVDWLITGDDDKWIPVIEVAGNDNTILVDWDRPLNEQIHDILDELALEEIDDNIRDAWMEDKLEEEGSL